MPGELKLGMKLVHFIAQFREIPEYFYLILSIDTFQFQLEFPMFILIKKSGGDTDDLTEFCQDPGFFSPAFFRIRTFWHGFGNLVAEELLPAQIHISKGWDARHGFDID